MNTDKNNIDDNFGKEDIIEESLNEKTNIKPEIIDVAISGHSFSVIY